MNKNDKIYVAGHNGMVGSSIVRLLAKNGFTNIITRSSKELDLCDQKMTLEFLKSCKPDYVFLSAAKVGGIYANDTYPAQFIYDNLMIASNVIHSSYLTEVKKLLFLGSSCIYPKFSNQPIKESELLGGYLEPTNEAYAIAKIAGLQMCKFYKRQYGCNFISAMPTNLYGINDNFDLQSSHVLPAMIRKFHEAKLSNQDTVVIWGTGSPKREFLHVDDLAEACLFLMNNYNDEEHVNVGTGEDISIMDLALLVKKVIGYKGQIDNDLSKPDGTPRKLLDITKIKTMGWNYKYDLEQGITLTYEWFLKNCC